MNHFFRTEFSRNVLALMTGTTIAQAIPLAISPILTRIYTPEDFGVLALFISISSILGVIANGQYEQAIVLPKLDKDAINLTYLGFLISLGLSTLLLLIIIFFNNQIASLLENKKIAIWLYFIPLAVLLTGIYNALNYFNVRKKKFKNVSISSISKSLGLSISQILLGLLFLGPLGLILGQVVALLSGNLILWRELKNTKRNNYLIITKEEIFKKAFEYRKFPIYSVPAVLLNSTSLNIISLLITSFFGLASLGYYSLSQRIIGAPSRIIGSSFSQVYFQRACVEYNQYGKTDRIFLKTFKKLVLISVPIFLIIYLTIEPLVSFVFGIEWKIAGTYAKIIIPLAAIRFVSSTMSSTVVVHQKQQYSVFMNGILLLTTALIFILAENYIWSFISTLKLYTGLLAVEYLLFLFIYWILSKGLIFKIP